MTMFKKSMLAMALTAAAGVAQASTIQIVNDELLEVNPVAVLDGEAVVVEDRVNKAGVIQFDLDDIERDADARARSIKYTPSVALANGLSLTFKVAGGDLVADTALGLVALHNGTDWVRVGSLNDYMDGANDGYSEAVVQLDLTDANNVDADFLNTDGQIKPDTALFLASFASGSPDNPAFTLNQSSKSLTVIVSDAQNTSGLPLNAPKTKTPAQIVEVTSTSELLGESVTSTIDVEYQQDSEKSRFGFVADDPVPASAPLTTETKSVATLGLDVGNAEITYNDGGYVLTVSRDDVTGVAGIEFAGNALSTKVGNSFELTFPDLSSLSSVAPFGELTIKSAENAVLATGTWNTNVRVTPNTVLGLTSDAKFLAGSGAIGSFALDKKTHSWDINGAQFKVPYHAQNAAGYNFFLKVVNETENDAPVFADVIVENVTQKNQTVVSNVEIGTAKATGNTTIGQKAILDAVVAASNGAVDAEDLAHLAMTLTVIAPQNSVQVTGFQSDAVGRTSVPVYLNNDSGREWFQ